MYRRLQNFRRSLQLQGAIYQVSLSLKDPETREREVLALNSAMKELSLSTGTIITLDEEDEIAVPSGIIKCIPGWKLM